MTAAGLLTVELELGEGSSLKDKRHIIKGMLERIRHRFNVSAAEVGHLDSLRSAELAVCAVANDRSYVNSLLDRVLRTIESDPRVSVVESSFEFL